MTVPEKKEKTKDSLFIPVIILQSALIITALINNGMMAHYYIAQNMRTSNEVRKHMNTIKRHNNEVAVLAYKFDAAAKTRLADIHIPSYDIDYLHGAHYKDLFYNATSMQYVMYGIPRIPKEELALAMQADIPEDAAVITPPGDLPESARELSGVWKGKISGIIDSIIIVKNIHKDLSADVIISLGEFKPKKIEKQILSVPARISITPRVSMVFPFHHSEISLFMVKGGNALEFIASRQYRGVTGYIRKMNPLTNKPYSDFSLVDKNLPVPLYPGLPFPDNITVTPPEKFLPDAIRGFSSLWEGKLGGFQEAALLVKRISITEADIMLSWGTWDYSQKGYYETVARVVNSNPPELICNTYIGKLRLTGGTTGYTMEGRFIGMRNIFSSLFFRKYDLTTLQCTEKRGEP
jgi:hypothetical protein